MVPTLPMLLLGYDNFVGKWAWAGSSWGPVEEAVWKLGSRSGRTAEVGEVLGWRETGGGTGSWASMNGSWGG